MLSKNDAFYDRLLEPNKSCFLTLRAFIIGFDSEIQELWKYGLPFFYYKKKPFAYFWKDKKTDEPYIGFSRGFLMEHPSLLKGERTRIKIFPVDPNADIDIENLLEVLELTKKLY